MSQGDTVSSGAENSRELLPRTWEFPDPRVAVLALLIVVALLLQGQFGSLSSAGVQGNGGSEAQEATGRR